MSELNNLCRFCLVLVCLLWFGAVVTRAAPHYVVPTNNDSGATSPFETWAKAATNIQDAVSAAADGETVWITNGTYFCQGICTNITGTLTNTAMVMITNSITVRSFSGQYSNTIVNGYYPAWKTRVFYLDNTGAVVSGLTITNGFSTSLSGVGVYIYNGRLMTNCLITGNILTNDTGSKLCAGIHMTSGTVSHCIIKGNQALGTNVSTAQIAGFYGGYYGRAIITNCLITENSIGRGSGFGNACYLYYGVGKIVGCTISSNSAGAGVWLAGGDTWLESSVVINNTGYGVYFNERGNVRNCLITKNARDGIYVSGNCGAKIENSSIVHNGGSSWRGIYVESYKGVDVFYIMNTISFYNGVNGTNNWYSTNNFYTNCCTYPAAPGWNNITNYPLFVDTNSGNYRLSANSPCINAGTNQNWMTNGVDLDWNARIRYGKVDIGAYEHINKGTVYNFQ